MFYYAFIAYKYKLCLTFRQEFLSGFISSGEYFDIDSGLAARLIEGMEYLIKDHGHNAYGR